MCAIFSIPDKLLVFFFEEKIVRKPHIVGYIQEMQKEDISKAIFIIQESLTPIAKKVSCLNINKKVTKWETDCHVDIFLFRRLQTLAHHSA